MHFSPEILFFPTLPQLTPTASQVGLFRTVLHFGMIEASSGDVLQTVQFINDVAPIRHLFRASLMK